MKFLAKLFHGLSLARAIDADRFCTDSRYREEVQAFIRDGYMAELKPVVRKETPEQLPLPGIGVPNT